MIKQTKFQGCKSEDSHEFFKLCHDMLYAIGMIDAHGLLHFRFVVELESGARLL